MQRMRTRSLSSSHGRQSSAGGGGFASSVGPTSWKTSTHSAIAESSDLVRQARRTVDVARRTDPLPGLREVAAGLSNDEAHGHFRRTRPVVHRLRDVTIDINTEIRAVNRLCDAIGRQMASIDRDLQVNNESLELRRRRPGREKATDGADGLLNVEKQQLINARKSLDVELGLCKKQLKILDAARRRLAEVTRERCRVLELVTQDPISPTCPAAAGKGGWTGSSGAADMDEIDPLGAYTPEVDEALREASNALSGSVDTRKSAERMLETVTELEQAIWRTVNSGLRSKVSETAKLKHQLDTAAEDNRMATVKIQKLFDNTELTWKQLQGPLNSQNLELREKLDRPVIKVMQRHPGNQMPEAHHIISGTESLMETLQCAGHTLGQLKLSQMRLQEDSASKKAAIDVDNNIMRMRRKKTSMYCAP